MNVGKKLLKIRKEKNISRRKVYDDTGIIERTLARYENEEGEIGLSTLIILCHYYGITVNELLDGLD